MSTEQKPSNENENQPTNGAPAPATEAQTTASPSAPESPVVTSAPETPSNAATAATPSNTSAPASTGNSTAMTSGSDDDDDDDAPMSGDMDFGAILEQFEQEQSQFSEGEVVSGRVVNITERGVLIDFGFKSEGVAAPEEFTNESGEVSVKPGDQVEVMIRSMDSSEGYPVLSRADAIRMRAWDDLQKAYDEGTPVKGRVVERIKGGLRVDINGVQAFLPGSQIDVRPVRNLDSFRDQEIEARVIKINRRRSNVVLSRKELLEEENSSKKGDTLENIEEGIIVEGQIKGLTEYGAFVDLGGIDGLLHVTDMSWGRLQNPNEMFQTGDHVQVKVLKFDRERERVSLGYKQLLPDPWETIDERYERGKRLNGKVASVTDYGAFIELEPGVEGLVHVSEMSWSKRMKHPGKMVNPGDTVEVQVLGTDPRARRISLGMKQMQSNPWETITQRYQVGTRVQGRVRNLTDFGAFIEIEDGVDGLVHVSDISWSKRIKHPAEALKKGQEVNAIVTNIDAGNHRLSLSIKDTEASEWDRFVNEHKPGDIVHGKISRFANFGAFVELADGLEGLCHVTELSDDRLKKPEDAVKVGDEMDFRILRIESDSKKIGLSARAAQQDEAISSSSSSASSSPNSSSSSPARTFSSNVGGGMASLGELADFGIGGGSNKASDGGGNETDTNQGDGNESGGNTDS